MSSALRRGGSARPSATHVCRSSVDIVRRRSRAMPPSGGRGLLHHSLRSVQGRGATTSLIPLDHVHGTNPFFPGILSSRAEWAPLWGRRRPLAGVGQAGTPPQGSISPSNPEMVTNAGSNPIFCRKDRTCSTIVLYRSLEYLGVMASI